MFGANTHPMKYIAVLAILALCGCDSGNDEPAPSDEPTCKVCATYVKEWHDTIGTAMPIEYILYPDTFCNHEWDTLEGRSSHQLVEVGGQWWMYDMVVHCQ
jgi:hypothetical protein